MRAIKISILLQGVLAVVLTAFDAKAQQTPVPLGTASSFVVLAGSGTTSFTGGGAVTGDVGVSPGSAVVVGTPPTTINGTVFANGPIAAQAQADLGVAINDAKGRTSAATAVAGNIGGRTLTPGLYQASNTSLAVTSGDLYLDALGDPNGVFIFQIGTTLEVSTKIFLTNGANANNIFWQVGSSATLGVGSVVHGNILASASITMVTGASLDGRALARISVTVDTGAKNSAVIPQSLVVPPPVIVAGQFIPVAPCRVADTRNATGAFGGPFIAGQTSRSFAIPSGSCGIPSTALNYSLNIAVVPHGSFAYLTAWATGQTQPQTTTLSSDGRIKSSAAIVPAGAAGAVSVFVTHDTDVVLDINGYFAPKGTPNALSFYPLPPCRLSDTRSANGPLGGPALAGRTSRTIQVLASSCGMPASAQAYSVNLAAVPRGPLGYLTAWPTGSPQPLVASLNATTGTVTSNAAIVPAGVSGSFDVYATDDTQLVIDINGYFAPPGAGGLLLYGLTPCRAIDTRVLSPAQPFIGSISEVIAPGACGVPMTAQAYVFNAVVIPSGPFGYLTLWDHVAPPPLVASLNAVDGAITSNMAIVAAFNGMIDVFASHQTQLVLEISGYFAP